jgi:hypothetical protein
MPGGEEAGAVKRQLHPLVTILIGAIFGGLLGAWIAWGLARAPTTDTAVWGGGIGAAVMAGIFGMAHAAHWAYHSVPTIRDYTKGAFAVGAAIGLLWSIIAFAISLFTGHREGHVRPHGDALLVGVLFGGVGFVLGCLVSVGRVILRRKRPPQDEPPGAG